MANLNDIFGANLHQSKKSGSGDGGVINLLSSCESTPVKSKPFAMANAKAALSPRMSTADKDDAISISSSVDPSNSTAATGATNGFLGQHFQNSTAATAATKAKGFLGHAAFDIMGNEQTLTHLIEEGHIAITNYALFQKQSTELHDEIARLVKKGLFSIEGRFGVGRGAKGKRGPVYVSTFDSESPQLMKQFLTIHQGHLCLAYIRFWEGICDSNNLEIVNVWITNYRSEENLTEEEWVAHHSHKGYIPCGYMVNHGDKYPNGVVARVTTTMFEKKVEGKVKKRFRVKNNSPNGEKNYAQVSFAAGNGTTVIMDSCGSGNGSDWRHGVEGAEDTYTITLQLKKIAEGTGGGNLKHDDSSAMAVADATASKDDDSTDFGEESDKKMPAKKSFGRKRSTAAAVPMTGRKSDYIDLTSDSDESD